MHKERYELQSVSSAELQKDGNAASKPAGSSKATIAASPRLSFASFWDGGRLPAFEVACLESFALRGHAVALFSYDDLPNLPEGVTARNAEDVVERRFTKAYLIDGKPSLSHFSDIFRYRLFKSDPDMIWIDTDMLLLRDFDQVLPRKILAKEAQHSLCGAIMRLENSSELDSIIERVEFLAGKELRWGQTGPHLLTRTFGRDRVLAEAYEPKTFFPIHFDDFWKVFLPEYRDECEAMCRDGFTLHLWNNIVVKLGIWKELLPPDGSYLNGLFHADGTDRYFHATYPPDVMRNMIENWRMRNTGVGLSLGQVIRQVAPSVLVTARKHVNRRRA